MTTTASPVDAHGPLSYRRRFAREQRISHALQHAIQPATSVFGGIDGLRVAVRYRGADPTVRLGGDWYLIQRLAGGDLLMAVGDVIGHGLGAVEVMIGLRYAMAAYAAEGHRPAAILSRLNTLLCGSGDEATATAVVAVYRPSTGRIEWAGAGHPPLLLADGRRAVPLPAPQGPLLGVFRTPPFGQESRQLLAGQSVLLYTDGMIKRGTFDVGIDLLADRIAGLDQDPADILDQLDFDVARDDACALLAQRTA
ncbi:serine/threonine-protein phosphatase [Micromonospora sp. PLK6-60]|uniref:PP2C family protein-serine/threonine phosphatase n=1 Tax=Micromonospora sp. PLK6-60 TaxID=2873383 RepID=UPI001CA65660|nr:PP2C family protein-serine/threonine phosphatase [Micromonospora sp. PLK6-60]MBY8870569.1 serine/threonine-protein phosphatase [Micromonospora sp. PLK6-60]